jgi:hypothetical protein
MGRQFCIRFRKNLCRHTVNSGQSYSLLKLKKRALEEGGAANRAFSAMIEEAKNSNAQTSPYAS